MTESDSLLGSIGSIGIKSSISSSSSGSSIARGSTAASSMAIGRFATIVNTAAGLLTRHAKRDAADGDGDSGKDNPHPGHLAGYYSTDEADLLYGIQSALLATTIAFFCVACTALSSKHLYAQTSSLGRMPFIAGVLWFIAAVIDTFLWLDIDQSHTDVLYFVLGILSWTLDIIVRCLIIAFTYYRVKIFWAESRFLWFLSLGIGVLQIGLLGVVLYADIPTSPVEYDSPTYNELISMYFFVDVLAAGLDALLLARLFIIKRRFASSPMSQSTFGLISSRFFIDASLCLALIMIMPVLMFALFVTGLDPYWGFNTSLYAFRIYLTDVLSNLIVDSLIEGHVKELERAEAQTTTFSDEPSSQGQIKAAPTYPLYHPPTNRQSQTRVSIVVPK
ncbi:hypothetical protein BC831DRAFT_481344 [Entophlyctis helioformis]|nr:hypothetical protein BC831DRAFT_481344 [Entophlyctis helioformis]